MNMIKVFLEKYKLINIILLVITTFVVSAIYVYINEGSCIENCSLELKKGLLNPLFSAGKILACILGVLIFFPSDIFKKWITFVAPLPLIVTFVLVSNISVYSSGVLQITRAQMAENGMFVLAALTALFIAGYLLKSWKKRK